MFRMLIAALVLVSASFSAAGAQQCDGRTGCTECDLPGTYTNSAVVTEGDITVTFASDKASYVPGEIVHFYLVVKNSGSSPWDLNWGVDPQDGIFVLPPPCAAPEPVADCFESNVFYHPWMVYYYSAGTTLDPGYCRVWRRDWDTNVYPAAAATYNVVGGMFEPSIYDPDTIGAFDMPTGGVLLNVTIEAGVGAETRSWGAVKTLYR